MNSKQITTKNNDINGNEQPGVFGLNWFGIENIGQTKRRANDGRIGGWGLKRIRD